MPKEITEHYMYATGAARFHDLLYLSVRDRALVEKEAEHSSFLGYDQGDWHQNGLTDWNTVAMCMVKHPEEKVVAISEDGEVWTYIGGKASEEQIKPAPSVLRAMATIDGIAYACGMKREVFKRKGEDVWHPMHAPAPKKGQKAGFEAIGGFTGSEIYAAGWEGEIWMWNGKKWSQLDSPVNLILTSVCCAPDDHVYVCGQEGTLLCGRRDSWRLISSDDVTDDFWDIRWFKDHLYVATLTGLFEYVGKTLEQVDFGKHAPNTCGRLTDADGVLWSIGADDVFSFDGKKWTAI